MCTWLDEEQVLEDLFGERAHTTIVSETATLLDLIKLTDSCSIVKMFQEGG